MSTVAERLDTAATPARETPVPTLRFRSPQVAARNARWRAFVSVVCGLILWEIVGRFVVTNPIHFAPLSKVLAVGWTLLMNGTLLHHLAVSSVEFGFGFALASVFGIGIGLLMATNRIAQDILDPWVSFFYSSPLVALMPFYLLIFGVGLSSKIAIVFTIAIFPILLNAFVGIRSTDPHLLEVAAAFNCTRRQIFSKILLPASLPYILVGLRLGIGRALTGVVVGELFASQAGLGFMITAAGLSFDTATVFLGVLIFSVIGLILMEGLKWLERWMAPWRKAVQEVR